MASLGSEELWIDYNCSINVTDSVGSTWIWEVFGQCIGNTRQWFAFCIGLASICFYMLAQLPQIVTNCFSGKADQALSFWLLLGWLIGDSSNLIGALLTSQLFTQIATAVYLVCIDCVTMSQFFIHLFKNQGLKGLTSCFKASKAKQLATFLPGVAFTLLLASSQWESGLHSSSDSRFGRTLKQIEPIDVFPSIEETAGYALGCVSALFYALSRVPQIIKNCRRGSVEGLSPIMFALTLTGDASYGVGILLHSVEPVFLLQKLPWLAGSIGCIWLDGIILLQFLASCISKRRQHHKDDEKQSLLGKDHQSSLCCIPVVSCQQCYSSQRHKYCCNTCAYHNKDFIASSGENG